MSIVYMNWNAVSPSTWERILVIFGPGYPSCLWHHKPDWSGLGFSWELTISNSRCFNCPKTATLTHPGYPTTESEWWLPCLLVFFLVNSKLHIRPLVQRGFRDYMVIPVDSKLLCSLFTISSEKERGKEANFEGDSTAGESSHRSLINIYDVCW